MKIELSHDILAKRIYDKASSGDKMLLKVRQFISDRLEFYEENQTLLNKEDLAYIYPFLNDLEISPAAADLLEKSKQNLQQRKRRILAFILFIFLLLSVFNYVTRSANRTSKALAKETNSLIKTLELEEQKKHNAEVEAQKYYDELMKSNPEFTEKLINSYDTLQQNKKALEKERNIAQSSTLSNLAEAALKQNDKAYAFKLAAKSWDLNHSNKHACDILYIICDDPNYPEHHHEHHELENDSIHDAAINKLIDHERSTKGRGKLLAKEMEAIFSAHNSVVNKKEDGIKDKVENLYGKLSTSARDISKEVGAAASTIQQ